MNAAASIFAVVIFGLGICFLVAGYPVTSIMASITAYLLATHDDE